MITGRIGYTVYDNFSVVDESNELVPSIPLDEFYTTIFNPQGTEVSNLSFTNVVELGDGHYRLNFTPNRSGLWYVVVYHDVYFPWGKSDEVMIYVNDIDQIAEGLARVLGLTQENYYLDNTMYIDYQGAKLLTNGRIRTYSNPLFVGTDSSVLATYNITSTWNGAELETYKVIKQ